MSQMANVAIHAEKLVKWFGEGEARTTGRQGGHL